MAAVIALGKTLGDNAVSVIFGFLENSSEAATSGMDFGDIADLRDMEESYIVAYWEPPASLHVLYLDSHCPNKFGIR